MRRIVLFGMPGSGKSTQGQKLAVDLHCPWISTGELLRASKEAWVQEKLETSELFDDHIVLKLLKDAIGSSTDVIIDGFPRNRDQAKMAIEELGVTEIIELTVPDEQVIERMSERGREQDRVDIAKQRIEDYKATRRDIEEVFWEHGMEIKRVDGVGTIDEVYERVKEVAL